MKGSGQCVLSIQTRVRNLKKNHMKFTTTRVRKYTLSLQFMSISQNVSFRGLFHLAVGFSVPWTRGPHQAVISVLCMVEDYFWWPWSGISQVWKMQGTRLGKHGKSSQQDAPSVLPLIKKTKFKRHYDINRWFWKSNERGQTFTFSQHWKLYQRRRVLDFQGKKTVFLASNASILLIICTSVFVQLRVSAHTVP